MDINKDDVYAGDSEVLSDFRSEDTLSKDRNDKGKVQDRKSEELKDIQTD